MILNYGQKQYSHCVFLFFFYKMAIMLYAQNNPINFDSYVPCPNLVPTLAQPCLQFL